MGSGWTLTDDRLLIQFRELRLVRPKVTYGAVLEDKEETILCVVSVAGDNEQRNN